MYGCNYLGFGPGGSFMGGGLMGGGFLGMFINILIIALIAYLIFKLVQNLGNNGVTSPRKSNRKDSVQILRERFARGDIDEDEYLKRKEILED
jgi:putative membrane protein